MRLLRRTREIVYKKIGVKPKKVKLEDKTKRAFRSIGATKEEREQKINMMTRALRRVKQRKNWGKESGYTKDLHNYDLIIEMRELLGRKRAEKFFEYMNDPHA